MPSPSPEARAKDKARHSGIGSYFKNGIECFYIHIGKYCDCCWVEITMKNSAGNGMCDICAPIEHRMPCSEWTHDMHSAYNKNKYLDMNWFNMKTRKLYNNKKV